MSATTAQSPTATQSVIVALLPIMTVVLVAFLVIGLALPVLPLHVHQGLGLGAFVVGLVAGSQFAASFVSRLWSGHYADSRGAKRAVVVGLLMAAVSGGLYLASLRFLVAPVTSVAVLLAGRALLGGAESFIITGAVSWGLALTDPGSTGKVIAWMGTAMFAAMALGAPVGGALYGHYGFASIALASALGWGVGLSAIAILLYQGTITLGAGAFDSILQGEALAAMTSAGGITIIGIALKLLDVKDVKVGNFLPALVFAPALYGIVSLVR